MKGLLHVLLGVLLAALAIPAMAGGGPGPVLSHHFIAEEATGEDWVKLQDRPHGSNDFGVRIYNQYAGGQIHAGLLNPDGSSSILESMPGSWESAAHDINNNGAVVGYSKYQDAPLGHATLWMPGEAPRNLGPVGDDFRSMATSLNDFGDVAVTVRGGPLGEANHWGGIWDGKTQTLFRLDDWILTPSVTIVESHLVNNARYMLCDGYLNGKLTSIRLSPVQSSAVPEPSTLPLILSGATVLAAAFRKRR